MEEILRGLRPVTFIFWGLILIVVAWVAWSGATPGEESSWLAHIAFPVLVVSWIAGVTLMIRVKLRGGSDSFAD